MYIKARRWRETKYSAIAAFRSPRGELSERGDLRRQEEKRKNIYYKNACVLTIKTIQFKIFKGIRHQSLTREFTKRSERVIADGGKYATFHLLHPSAAKIFLVIPLTST